MEGYSITTVARAWSLAWAIMNNVDLPHQLPEALASDLAPARNLRDPAHVSGRQEIRRQRMKEVVEYLEKYVLPIHGTSK